MTPIERVETGGGERLFVQSGRHEVVVKLEHRTVGMIRVGVS
jgi:hypothetical protein